MENGSDTSQPVEVVSAFAANTQLFKHLLCSLKQKKDFQSEDNSSIFVVYAHDREDEHSEPPAYARCAIQIIKWLNTIGARVLSDRYPAPRQAARSDGDICLTNVFHNQMCLLPTQVQQSAEHSITAVDKVILWASPLLESYCAEPWAEIYMRQLNKIYWDKRHRPRSQLTEALHDHVDQQCRDPRFHHVVTEVALLQLRWKQLSGEHGVIPVTMDVGTIPYVQAIRPTDLKIVCDPKATDLHRFFFKLLKQVFPMDRHIINIHLEAYMDFCVSEDISDLQLFDKLDLASRSIYDAIEQDIHTSERAKRDRRTWGFSDRHLQKRQSKFLTGLTTLSYADRKNRNVQSQAGTCQWAVKHASFIRWANTKDVPLLFISTNPGCGKSVLCRHLIDHELKESGHTVSYFFFKADFMDQRSATSALRCILHQIFSDQAHLLNTEILDKFDRKFLDLDSFTHLWDTLISVTLSQQAREVICILDALDECDTSDKGILFDAFANINSKARIKFLVTSRPYHDEMVEFHNLKRNQYAVIHISGDRGTPGAMLHKEINQVIYAQVSGLTRFSRNDQEIIYTELTKNPNRTYLWVKLVIDLIKSLKATTRSSLVEQVRRLPRTVDEAYENLLNKIEEQDEPRARKLLNIVLAAERPLTVAEMALALQLEVRHWTGITPEIPHEKIFRDDVRTICGLFVTVVAGRIYLLHQTAREFLLQVTDDTFDVGDSPAHLDPTDWRVMASRETRPRERSTIGDGGRVWRWKSCFSSTRAHALMAEICMIRISLRDASAMDVRELPDSDYESTSDTDMTVNIEANTEMDTSSDLDSDDHSDAGSLHIDPTPSSPLLAYAEETWVLHCNAARNELHSCMDIAYRICFRETHLGFEHYIDGLELSFVLSTTLMAAVYFNLETVTDQILLEKPEDTAQHDHRETIHGFTALHIAFLIASSPAHTTTGVIGSLLKAGANVNAQDNEGRTVLHLATYRTIQNWHNVDVIDLLLENGADPNIASSNGETAFRLAASLGLVSVVKLFQLHGFYISETQGGDGKAMANLISQPASDPAQVSRIVTETPAALEATDSEKRTPLHRATLAGRPDIVRKLLELGANVNALTASLETPLDLAVRRLYLIHRSQQESTGTLEVVRALWFSGGTINKLPNGGKTASEISMETNEGQFYAFLHQYESHAIWRKRSIGAQGDIE